MTNQQTAQAIRQMHELYVINTVRWTETSMPFTFFGDRGAMLQAVATGQELDVATRRARVIIIGEEN